MAKKDSLTNRLRKPKRVYTIDELKKFEQSVLKYMKTTTGENGEAHQVPDWEEIYIRAGVKTKGKPGYADNVVAQTKPNGQIYIPFIEFENKREQYEFWKAGLNWVEEQRLKGLDDVYTKEDHEFDHFNDEPEVSTGELLPG